MSLKDKKRIEDKGWDCEHYVFLYEDVKEAVLQLLKYQEEFYNNVDNMGNYPNVDEWIEEIFGDFE